MALPLTNVLAMYISECVPGETHPELCCAQMEIREPKQLVQAQLITLHRLLQLAVCPRAVYVPC